MNGMVVVLFELVYLEFVVFVEMIEGWFLGLGCNDCGVVFFDVVVLNDRSLLVVECRCNSLLDFDVVFWRRILLIL